MYDLLKIWYLNKDFLTMQFHCKNLIILRYIENMESKIFPQIGAFFYPMFANWARVNEPTLVVHVSEWQIFKNR